MVEKEQPKSKAEELLEAKDWFRDRTKYLRKFQTISETREKMLDADRDKRVYMNAKWSWNLANILCTELLELWDVLEGLMMTLIEEEHDTPDLEKQIKSLTKELRKHRPALREMTRIMNDGKEQLRRYR